MDHRVDIYLNEKSIQGLVISIALNGDGSEERCEREVGGILRCRGSAWRVGNWDGEVGGMRTFDLEHWKDDSMTTRRSEKRYKHTVDQKRDKKTQLFLFSVVKMMLKEIHRPATLCNF